MFKRVIRIIKAWLESLFTKFEDPSKMLESGLDELHEKLEQLTENYTGILWNHKQIKKKIEETERKVKNLVLKAKHAKKESEKARYITAAESLVAVKQTLESQFLKLESAQKKVADKIQEVKTLIVTYESEKDALKTRYEAAKLLRETSNTPFADTRNIVKHLEDMKNKVLKEEFKLEVEEELQELTSTEETFPQLESSEIDKRLKKLEALCGT